MNRVQIKNTGDGWLGTEYWIGGKKVPRVVQTIIQIQKETERTQSSAMCRSVILNWLLRKPRSKLKSGSRIIAEDIEMSEAVREMTREELISQKAKLEEQCRVLANRCDMKESRIKEMQSNIDCLKAELAEVQMNKQELPLEPIDVASMLIKETVLCKTNPFQKAFNEGCPDEYEADRYSEENLRQIAEHLLVYCNHTEAE